MSDYIAGLSCIAIVLSPLFIPIAVTVVDWVYNWRSTPRAAKPAVATQLRAPALKAARLRLPAE
jgi:hypothetical protein